MRQLRFSALALFVVVGSSQGQSKPATVPPEAKSPAQQIAELQRSFERDYRAIAEQFGKAKEEERFKLREQAFRLAPEYAAKIMDVVKAHPKDPAAVEGLVWIAIVGPKHDVPPPPQSADAFARIVEQHLESPGIGELCRYLESYPSGEKFLRRIREKNTSNLVRALAAMSLGTLLSDDARKPTPKQLDEAEKLIAAGIAEAKAIRSFPEDRLHEAEGTLYEIRNLSVGKMAPELESHDLTGNKVRLSDLKGKVVVLDIWTTWCVPCKAMIPHERELVKRLTGKPFVLISISADTERGTLTKFLSKESMPWTHWWNGDRGGVLEQWNVKYFPTIYVIDAKGAIRAKNIKEKELDETVEALVKEAEKR